MKIGVFGGCFNPPHASHKKIAEDLIREGYVERVVFVPTSSTYDKPGLTPFEYRFKMLEAMIGERGDMCVSSVGAKGCEYTYQVMDALQIKYPNSKLYFICGTDNLAELDTWKQYEYILQNYGILTIRRNDDDVQGIIKKYEPYKSDIIVSNVASGTLSSTAIRKAIEADADESIRDYLDAGVFDYIERYGLYKRKREEK